MAGRLVVLVAVAAALAVASVAAAADDVQPPDGAVGGVQSQAAGVLHLSVLATDGGVGLDRASAALDGAPVAEAAYGNGECCPAVGTVTLDVDTTAVADGAHVLTVVVADAAGNAKTLVDQTITVLNTPPKNRDSVTVTVGSGATSGHPGSGGGHGGVKGSESERGCRAPRLSVSLVTAPLRIRRGVPVLVRGRKYLYRGTLTCRIDGRRRAARRGTNVELRHVIGGRVVSTRRLTTGRHGRFALRLAVSSTRVLVFRVRGSGGNAIRVRIPVRVARRAHVTQVPVGGTVPSFLALALDDVSGFARFKRAGSYTEAIRARVTSTDRRAALSVADGDVADGRALGRMASAAALLRAPLEARVGGAFAALDAPVEPSLEEWPRAVANERTVIRLRQRVGRNERGGYRKTVLITLSPDAP